MGRCGAVCQCLTRQVLPSTLVRFFTGLGLLLAVTVTSTMPAQAQFNAAIESQSPNQGLPHGPLPNDCGLRAVIFLLAEKGLYPALQTLVNLLSHRYTTTGGKPIGEGYSLSDLQWVLESFGVSSRGFFVSRSWLQEDKPPAILRLLGKAGGHFVVLQSVDASGMARIYDPSRGCLEIPLEVLAARWADFMGRGVVLVMEGAAHTVHNPLR